MSRWLCTLLGETGYEPDKLVLFVATLAVAVVIIAGGGGVAAPVIFSGERTSSN